jgi:hypothetical protein
MKTCSRCKQSKNELDFHKGAKYCKPCKKEYNQENKAHLKEIRKANHIKNKDRDNMRNKRYYQEKDKTKKRFNYFNKVYFDSYSVPNEKSLKKILSKCAGRAKELSLNFDLTVDFVLALYESQNGKCALTGLEFDYARDINFVRRPFAPSIDRIDNKKGYTKDNVRFVCVAVNIAVNEFGDAIFDKICRAYIHKKDQE